MNFHRAVTPSHRHRRVHGRFVPANALGEPTRPRHNSQNPGSTAAESALEGLVKQEFAFDPSRSADDGEGSIAQALLLMNDEAINRNIRATGATVLARILKDFPDDDEGALRRLYLRILARKPTERELA